MHRLSIRSSGVRLVSFFQPSVIVLLVDVTCLKLIRQHIRIIVCSKPYVLAQVLMTQIPLFDCTLEANLTDPDITVAFGIEKLAFQLFFHGLVTRCKEFAMLPVVVREW